MTEEKQSLKFTEILLSTLAAALGVQNRRNMERDFTHGEFAQFMLAGLVFTVVFVLTMVALVSLAMANL